MGVYAAVRAVVVAAVVMATVASASTPVKNIGIHSLPGGAKHWALTADHETVLFAHNITTVGAVGLLNYFWIESGRGSEGRYVCDTMVLRYYIDGEITPSLEFTPSMAAGSGVGFEPLSYYRLNHSEPAVNCTPPNVDGCGMDLEDGWPWQTRLTGKGGSEGNWVLHFPVPFRASVRVTAQLAGPSTKPAHFARADAPVSAASAYVMLRGLEGPEDAVRVDFTGGMLALPPIGSGNLRLRSYTLPPHCPAHGEFVPIARWAQPRTAGAVVMTTVSYQGLHTVTGDVEMCTWALTSASAEYNGTGQPGEPDLPFLLGTGMEDYYGNSFSLSWCGRTYHNDDAGLTHIHGGPIPPWGPVNSPTRQFTSLFSAYRMFAKDPLVFQEKLEVALRYMPPSKCSLKPTESISPPTLSSETVFNALAIFYTWDA